jgi:ribosomal protein S18 acetylase RimI-like enzyme
MKTVYKGIANLPSIFSIEEMSMNAWPSLQTLIYDGWIIRLANGYGNRANSINPIYPSKIKLEEKFKHCDELFMAHNLPASYKLINCEEHEIIEKKLVKKHYRKINETSIQVCKIKDSISRPIQQGKGIVVSDTFTEKWMKSVIKFNGEIGKKHEPTFRKIIGNIAVEKIVVHKEVNGKIIGCGCGVIENNYVGIFDVVVKEELRGKGYGREIVETILSQAAKLGVKNTYLQVMLNNSAALHLYKKMGYKEIYQYWYRKKLEQ